MAGPLDGIRVLDLSSGLAGAVATMVLCDNGAEVIKLEPPGGDPQRSRPAFAQWHRGKQSAVADLRTPYGRRRAQELAAEADVLVQAWRPGGAERLGLGYDELSRSNPGLVYCSISGFGPRGPYAQIKGYEAIVGAKAGTMAGEDRPRFAAIPGASFGAAQGALQGILAALLLRASTGRGQKVETSLVQGLTAYELYNWLGPQLPAEQASKPRTGFTFSPVSGMVAFTRDGRWLQFSNFRPHLVDAFLAAVGLTDYYADAMARKESAQVITDTVLRRLHEKTLDEWMEIFLRSDDIGVEPFRTPAEALDHPQMLHNGHVLERTDPSLGKTRQVGPLVRMTKTPSSPRAGAPVLGSLSLQDAAFTSPRTAEPAPPGPADPWPGTGGPLRGVTVLELAWFYAAPFGTALLADLGARVIKVESATGDPHRNQNPLPEFAGVKALGGKESIVVDYRTPEGREVLHRLVAKADIVMRNYRQQNSAAVGDDYASLEPANPGQVYLYAAAYGSDGPYTTRPAFAPTMGVAAGHRGYQLGWERALEHRQSITFEAGQEQLAAINLRNGGPTNNADAASALVVATGMLLGLLARQRTGQGQYLETTMMCSNAYVVSDQFFDYDGKTPTAHHDENGIGPLYRLYPALAGWVFLAAPRDADWDELRQALATVTGADVLGDDPRFATPADRAGHGPELAAALAAIFSSRPAADWEARLVPQGVACVEVSRGPFSEFTINDPTMVDNGFVAEVEHPLFGRHHRHGPIVTMASTPGTPGPGCLVGQHTRRILSELGYTDDQMAEWRDRHIVAWPEPPAG